LRAGDALPCPAVDERPLLYLPRADQPRYQDTLTVRVIPGYQQHLFSRREQRRFFGGPYRVSERCDRMGYRLEGPAIHCAADGILSEGICLGAIQLPPDGQPIVLLNDRQTIGGYPKIGSALSLDLSRLAQMTPGGTVHFAAISPGAAHRALDLARRFVLKRPLKVRGA
jgi:allophanate hydrolase subunit 2